jgi:hypothetical protein
LEFLTNGENFKDLVIDDDEFQATLEEENEKSTETKSHTMPKGIVNLEKIFDL